MKIPPDKRREIIALLASGVPQAEAMRVFAISSSTALRLAREAGIPPQRYLTEAEVRAIRASLEAGEKQVSIAARFGITQPAVSHIACRLRHK